MPSPWLSNLSVWLAAAMAAVALAWPRLRKADRWRATVTPLASIIGSGFLVLGPLLLHRFGNLAAWVMAGLCGLAYAVGAAIRFNILALENGGGTPPRAATLLDRVASWALAFAYVISVCYYLNLFGAFAVRSGPLHGVVSGRVVTSAILMGIAALGMWRGLRGLERAETISVSLKLAVIAGLLAGLAVFAGTLAGHHQLPDTHAPALDWSALPFAFGLVITVQGFETSRYLGQAYAAPMRVRSMRDAQWLSTAIYIAYIGLASVAFTADSVPNEETAVIAMMAPIASTLPALLILAALAAQFSAAVADTNGCGGLVYEMTGGRIPARTAYALLAAVGLVLTWTADIYQIISDASRAFSAYYALQCALAAVLARRQRTRRLAFAALSVLMTAAALLGVPAE
ncbi:hypothetical protein [Pseudoxanthomonas sp. JBR18]|uniref:hypothetical protein n=1 Tax=Pseudoxanthomonas sp. JBR18 TaxID=2969308 RepID=UPI002304DC04|nr:hypothetical protein [Pseudoxanthomonas sp. JBR18]WCE04153.1 hypothetical protein PJ250_19100 [Pseudoxanthomonas sp. JBR18]